MTLAFAALDVSAPSNEKSVVYLAAKEGGEATTRVCVFLTSGGPWEAS